MSWEANLSPRERQQWEDFVTHTRKHVITQMMSSAYVTSLCPDSDEVDIKFAVETGLAILLDKPIIAVALAGRVVPPGLARIAHAVIEIDDIDTEAAQAELGCLLKDTVARIDAERAADRGPK